MSVDKVRTIRVLEFSGKEEDWNRWSKTFLAMAKYKDFNNALMKMASRKAPTAEENTQAYNELLFLCQENLTFGIIDEATSKMFPEGDARVAWQNLKESYEPDTGAVKVQLRLESSGHHLEKVKTQMNGSPNWY